MAPSFLDTFRFPFLRHAAISNACRKKPVVWRLCIDKLTTRLAQKSIMTARQALQRADAGDVRHPDAR